MMKKTLLASVLLASSLPLSVYADEPENNGNFGKNEVSLAKKELPDALSRFTYNSGLDFKYPDAVRGIYVTGFSAGGSRFKKLVDFVDKTELNSMVIDVKDDTGNVTYEPEDHHSPYAKIGKNYISNPKSMLKVLEKKKIYPIARVVVFKDSVLSKARPDLSYVEGKELWKNGRGESFVNPFLKEVWDYNVGIAIEAAKMGFQEVQFDYVRFPEGFEKRDKTLKYSMGPYKNLKMDNAHKRVRAVTDFVKYARGKLKPYGVKVSADIFGYTATLPEAPGIGQNFSKIAENVDVVSSMVYPSHWTSYFGISKPDLQPYQLLKKYGELENKKLAALKTPPQSRPWIQDFTASYLGAGNYQKYGKKQVEDQIRALKDSGIKEYLLWNAGNTYSENVDYTP
ncbi:putative glycoside hydrolase [Actinomycetes bacterium NPDC127524]